MFFLKKILFAIVAVMLGVVFGVGGLFLWSTCSKYFFSSSKSESTVVKEPSIVTGDEFTNVEAEVIPAEAETVDENGFPLCENADEIATFEKPVPIVWKVKFGGCVESCYGGVFDMVSGNEKYPVFLGYPVKDEELLRKMLDAESIKEETTLKVTGKWTAIDLAYANTLFGGKCVPIVDIERIEVLQK